jgi:uncharacterized protein (DUF58 family)
MEVKVTKGGYMVLVTASAFLAYSIVEGSQGPLYGLSLLLYALALYSYAFVELGRNVATRSLVIKRDLSGLRDAERSRVVLRLSNRGLMPLLLELEDEPPERFLVIERPWWRILLLGGSEVRVGYRVTPAPGLSRFRGVRITVRDPLFMFYSVVELEGLKDEVRLPPKPVFSPSLGVTISRLAGMTESRRRRGRGTAFLYVKEYVEGDELRHIDWKAFARLGRLLVKVFEEESYSAVNVILVLDRNAVRGAGVRAFDTALRLSASLIHSLSRLGVRLSLRVIARGVVSTNRLGAGEAAVKNANTVLAQLGVEDAGEVDGLNAVLSGLSGLNIVITSDESLVKRLAEASRGTVVYYVSPRVHEAEALPQEEAERLRYLRRLFLLRGGELRLVIPNRVI